MCWEEKGETWRVLQEFNCSWKKGSCPQREIETGYFWGLHPPRPPLLLGYPLSTPLQRSHTIMFNPHPSLIAAHQSDSTTAQLTPIDSVKAYEIHALASFADK